MVVKKQAGTTGIRIPETLTLKDLISIISVAVSITLAWGYFGARIAALEKETVQLRADVSASQATIHALEANLQANELFVDQLFTHLNLAEPRRRYLDGPTYKTGPSR